MCDACGGAVQMCDASARGCVRRHTTECEGCGKGYDALKVRPVSTINNFDAIISAHVQKILLYLAPWGDREQR